MYYVINCTRLVLYYGICYTGPSVYNSNGANLFAFSVFLSAQRFLVLGFKCMFYATKKKVLWLLNLRDYHQGV